MNALFVVLALLAGGIGQGAAPSRSVTLRGRVVDARTGEPVAKALVTARALGREALTDSRGRFEIRDVPIVTVELLVTTVGYGLAQEVVVVSERNDDVEVRLSQEALRRTEEVAVTTGPFEPADPAAPVAHELSGTELKNLANVLVDDPLRSVQALPGVAASDDFSATFAARGLGFSNVGFYVDGVLLESPFHTVRDANDTFSLTLLNGDVVESLTFLSGGAPARYGDRIGSMLNLKTRHGSAEEFFGRVSLGAAGLYATAEAPLGATRKTSWLASARKSYLDYVLAKLDQSGMALGYYDTTLKVTHRPRASHTLALGVIHGRSRWRRAEEGMRAQSTEVADAGTDLATLQWRYLPSSRGWLESVAFFSRETGLNRALDGTPRLDATSRRWGLRTDALRVFGGHRVEGGLVFRRLSDDVLGRTYDRKQGAYRTSESYAAQGFEAGVYAQDGISAMGGRLGVTLGARLEHFGATRETRAEPRASLTFALSPRLRAFAAFGTYAQFPGFEQLRGRYANADLHAETSAHFLAGGELELGAHTRVRVEAYDEKVDGMIYGSEKEWRLDDPGAVGAGPSEKASLSLIAPRAGARWTNGLAGHSRGIEVLVQRRSANGLAGWVAYSYGHARWRDEAMDLRFDGDFDQRHTLTAFGSWRVRPTLSLSTKYRFGSGFPVAGFFEERGDGVFVSADRNRYRPEVYSRFDARANKAFVFTRFKLTVYAEVVNVLNRTHTRYNGLDSVDPRTGRVSFETDRLFPLLPALGVTVDF